MDKYFAWKHFVVGVVALALTAGFVFWYGEKHPPVRPPVVAEAQP